MAPLGWPRSLGQCTAALLLSISLSCVCHAQITPASSPLLAQVASTPAFAGQSFNTTVSGVDQNAIITAKPDFSVRSAPERLSSCDSGRLMNPTTPAGPLHSASRCAARPAEAWTQQQQSRRLPVHPQHIPRTETFTLARLPACCWARWPRRHCSSHELCRDVRYVHEETRPPPDGCDTAAHPMSSLQAELEPL